MHMTWTVVGLSVDAVVVFLFYKLYQNSAKAAQVVEETEVYNVGSDLLYAVRSTDDRCLQYVGVTGRVEAVSKPLRSQYTDDLGVIQHILLVEHKSERKQGFWTNVKNVIKDRFNTTAFRLVAPNGDVGVDVEDPLSAELITDALTVTHDHFEANTAGALSRGIDRIFGEVSKGFQETEKMLRLDERMLAFGTVTLHGGSMKLSPPDDTRDYILTTHDKAEVVQLLKSKARTLKMVAWLCGALGAGVVIYMLYKYYVRQKEQRDMDSLYAEVLRQRQQVAAHSTDGDSNGEEDQSQNCVICLTNPREIVILNCGHICVCADCAQALPTPRRCPICRADIERLVLTYRP